MSKLNNDITVNMQQLVLEDSIREKHDLLVRYRPAIMRSISLPDGTPDFITDFLLSHIQVQWEISIFVQSHLDNLGDIIFETESIPYFEGWRSEYLDGLRSCYNSVQILLHNGLVYGYDVSDIKPVTKKIYLELEKQGLLNQYVTEFSRKYTDQFCQPFTEYSFCNQGDRVVEEDPFLAYWRKAAHQHSLIGLGIKGFTKEEILENRLMQNLIATIGKITVTFSDGISVGFYALNHAPGLFGPST